MADKLYRRLGAHNPLGERKAEHLRQLSGDGQVAMHFRGPGGNTFTKVFGDFVHVSGGTEPHRGLYAMGYFGGKTQVIGSVDGYEWELGGRIPADLDNFTAGGSFVHAFAGHGALVGEYAYLGAYTDGTYYYRLFSTPTYLTWDGTSAKQFVEIITGSTYSRDGFATWLPEATVQRPGTGPLADVDGMVPHTESLVSTIGIFGGVARPTLLAYAPEWPGTLYVGRHANAVAGALIDAHVASKLSACEVLSAVHYVRPVSTDMIDPPGSSPGYMFDGPLASLGYTKNYARADRGPWVALTAAMIPALDFVLSAGRVPFNPGGADPNQASVFNTLSEQISITAAAQTNDLILLLARVPVALTPSTVWRLLVIEVNVAIGTSRFVDMLHETSSHTTLNTAYLIPAPWGMLVVMSSTIDRGTPDAVYRYRYRPSGVPAAREEAGVLPAPARNCGFVTVIDDQTLVVPAYVGGRYRLFSAQYAAQDRAGPPLPLVWREMGILHPTAPAPSNPDRTHLEIFPRVLRLQEPSTDPAPAFPMLPWMDDYREPRPE